MVMPFSQSLHYHDTPNIFNIFLFLVTCVREFESFAENYKSKVRAVTLFSLINNLGRSGAVTKVSFEWDFDHAMIDPPGVCGNYVASRGKQVIF